MALYDGEGGGVAAVGSITGCGQGPSRGFTALDVSADGCYEEVLRGSGHIDYALGGGGTPLRGVASPQTPLQQS